MVNKESYLQHIKDHDLKQLLVKILDQVELVLKNHDIKTTDFLNPYELRAAIEILSTFQDIAWMATGGYEGAERKILIIFQDYLPATSIKIPLAVLELMGNMQFKTLNHRDYLGAILSLGIKRGKIGDIIINEDNCQVIIKEELKDFLQLHLNKVGNTSIENKEIALEEIKPLEISYKEIGGTVASLRLDSIVSLGFKVSRAEAQNLIAKEKVYINWGIANKNFFEVGNGDVISVRGKGRVIIEDFQRKTKSGRIHIKLKKPI
ncbi:RNA-binding protein [Clostridium formicaceticum]|uniref:RNA-binding protein n=1 Tax=Clostridium formicaceticum TaxID=1497 RepID=A0AAC9RIX7_9CLOT|nr:YlmH/Sll1252 family protein [Clostridium formicaceticum]AOY77386.1 RNA-binding protein [Clostridium formicaceticum]ARE87936.1 S4 domain protein [Clostridium formicaceticum]